MMPVTADQFSSAVLEIGKVRSGGLLGFFAGRFEYRRGALKDSKSDLTAAIRSVAADAVEYHLAAASNANALQQSQLLKLRLRQVATDLKVMTPNCKRAQREYFEQYAAFFDAVTEFPFEPTELPQSGSPVRSDHIGSACEKLVGLIAAMEPRLL